MNNRLQKKILICVKIKYIVNIINSMIDNIDKLTTKNKYYRKVLYTTNTQQVVLMNIPYKEEIGLEKHKHTTQFIKIESGKGYVVIANKEISVGKGDMIIVEPNTLHNVVSDAKTGLKLYTIYSPPEHKPGLVQKKKPINDT